MNVDPDVLGSPYQKTLEAARWRDLYRSMLLSKNKIDKIVFSSMLKPQLDFALLILSKDDRALPASQSIFQAPTFVQISFQFGINSFIVNL
jgi:hypothetical protein